MDVKDGKSNLISSGQPGTWQVIPSFGKTLLCKDDTKWTWKQVKIVFSYFHFTALTAVAVKYCYKASLA
jgi:hypothetical protein